MAGQIIDIAYEGGRSLHRVALDDGSVMMVATANIARTPDGSFRRGETIWLGWAADAGHPLDT
ncbi:MAG: TOBE domain-containing protein [Reyranella sp.]|nr:TOBE domain-containing protein [Reyranella sp.]